MAMYMTATTQKYARFVGKYKIVSVYPADAQILSWLFKLSAFSKLDFYVFVARPIRGKNGCVNMYATPLHLFVFHQFDG